MWMFAFALFALTAAPNDVPSLAKAALDGDANAVAELRALGQPGLDALVALRRSLASVPPRFVGPQTPQVLAWEDLVDAVAKQRYASASGLYWYTDFEAAKAAAQRQNKPILSLRLLGQLDADLSCANSRFFRTILYPDPAIAKLLHDGYILHWKSVHDVPTIAIDFGDGRKLTRTITGNSMHYVMTPDGQVTDLMPGMVAPTTFSDWLASARAFTLEVARRAPPQRKAAIVAHLRGQLDDGVKAWALALRAVGVSAKPEFDALAAATTDDVLERLGSMSDARISPEAEALVGPMMGIAPRPLPSLAERAMPLAIGKSAGEAPTLRQLRPVEGYLARDDVKNRFELRSRLLTLALAAPDDEATLTTRIYAEVFFTPLDDPWMGLAPADVFTGLPPELEKSKSLAGREK